METFLEILKVIGGILLLIMGFILINVLGYTQATWDMTPEEKKAYDKYIEENGILGGDDDSFP